MVNISPFAVFIRDLAIILIVGKLFEELFSLIDYPPVLGDILAGIIIGPTVLGLVQPNEITEHVAWFGVAVLLFLAGLETRFSEFRHYFTPMSTIAVLGVIVSFALGYAVGSILSYDATTCLILGALLVATSVSITVKTMIELKVLNTPEGMSILGAAVLDDILGLLVLTLVLQIVHGRGICLLEIAVTMVLALLFWFTIVFLGHRCSRHIHRFLSFFKVEDSRYVIVLALMLLVAHSSEYVRLAPIVGAYAFGLALSEMPAVSRYHDRLAIIANTFATVFFVYATASLDFKEAMRFEYILLYVLVLTSGIISKVIGCGIGAIVAGFDAVRALRVGVGMMPRGEVCLTIATLGLALDFIPLEVYLSAIVLIYVSTLLTPPMLKLLYSPRIVNAIQILSTRIKRYIRGRVRST
ncbi:MAG: cation:proton antiporter [Thermoprotei archaeon]|nr:MAG: cation:proton antiporter [Thermoprotei archaeon]